MRLCNEQKPCINSTLIAWLIHGFLPVKTWLLIACNTAFNAIIVVYRFYCMPLYNFQTRRHVILVSIQYFNALGFCGSFMLFLTCFAMLSCTSVCWYLVVSCWEKGWPLGSRLWCLIMTLSHSHWYSVSGVVLDCIDSWSLPIFLLKYKRYVCDI